jgi:uncharacterized heparinase superfamily protein
MPQTFPRFVRDLDLMARTSKKLQEEYSRVGSKDVLSRVKKAWGESPFYQAQLKGPAPDRLLYKPEDLRSPDKEFARSLARGRIAMGEESADSEGELERLWDLAEEDGALSAYLQEFSWLRHLEALGEDGKAPARMLLKGWLDRYEKWSADAWEPYYVSERLVELCSHYPLVLGKTDALWRSRVLSSMARQTRHLARTAHRAENGFDRLMTSLGLSIAGFCLPGCEGPAERGLEMSRRELRLQLRPDGGHVSRNPSRQLKLALRLQTLIKTIEARGFQSPGFLRHMVVRCSAMATFFRCPDGRLAVFNGGYEVFAVEKTIDPETALADFARHSGYHKLTAARALLIVDTANDAGSTFKSAGSFHFSSGRSRIFVNCGNGGHRSNDWRKALELSAAHTALSFLPSAGALSFGEISHHRAEENKGHLLEFERKITSARSENAAYTRRLFLSSNGADLRGEENLSGLTLDNGNDALWRFHLHPSVRASLARDRKSVILLLPNKEGWRFKSNCTELLLEKSVYCGDGGAPVSTEQIVVRASHCPSPDPAALAVRWALRRLDAC